MFNSILGYFSCDLAIDIGSSNLYIAQKDKGIVVNQPCVIALGKKSRQIIAVGDKAKEMIGKSSESIEIIFPLKSGVITDLDAVEKILTYYIKLIHKDSKENIPKIPRPKVLISIPYDTNEVERRAVVKTAKKSGCRQVDLIESPLAAALGTGISIMDATGNLIVDIGGGTTEIAVISLGGIVTGKSLKVGGIDMDEAIINYIKNRFSVLIGSSGSEVVKISIANFNKKEELKNPASIDARGRNIKTGLPQIIKLSKLDIDAALLEIIDQIIDNIKLIVEETPPELISDILQNGIYLVGGGSKINGFAELLSEELKIKVNKVEDRDLLVVRGSLKLLNDPELLKLLSKKIN